MQTTPLNTGTLSAPIAQVPLPCPAEPASAPRRCPGSRPCAAALLAGLLAGLCPSGEAATRYVNLNNAAPAPPYTTWATAATNIQDAVDVAATGEEILVTNGVYQTGARGIYGGPAWYEISNRVAVTKPVTVRSVNGPAVTQIVGSGPIGPAAVRCVYLASGAALVGFTLTNGATQASSDFYWTQCGGGVCCAGPSAVVSNCVLTGNSAYQGGGASGATLNNCTLTGNSADYGGGASGGKLNNCTLTDNSAGSSGGGASGATLNNCTLTGNSASHSGGGAYSGTLSNCTLTGNSASAYGGGAYGGTLRNCALTGNSAGSAGGGAYQVTLNNCTLTGNSASDGGGAYYGTLSNCTLTGNSASSAGGAAYEGTLNNCTLTGNSASNQGGGVYGGTLRNCALTGNSASQGGGACGGTLNNCTLTGNTASDYGGGANEGTLNHCTLTGNSASSGGGAYGATLANCIVYFNRALFNGPNYLGGTLNNCCTTPLPASGTGNLAEEPQLASAWRLSAASPCIGRGSAAYTTGTDLDGEAWATPPAIGCDEYWSGSVTGALSVAVGVTYMSVAVGIAVDLQAVIEGRVSASRWDFGGGLVVSNRPWTSHAWAAAGDYVVELRAYNETYPAGVAATVTVRVVPREHYVALDSGNPVPPYNSWATAATNIQDALDAAVPGALVLVSNGVYQTGARVVYGMSNRVAVTKLAEVQSVNGPAVTHIVGYQVPGATNGPAAVRCVYLTNGSSLSGFTLTNGATQAVSDWPPRESGGGGVWCEGLSAVVSNCVLTGNSAFFHGGGAYQGTLNHCTLTGNSAYYGGGAAGGTLNDCTLTGNSSGNWGGGTYNAHLNHCALTGNSAGGSGGGAGGGAR
jgi:parallel beta-helix repeat protein